MTEENKDIKKEVLEGILVTATSGLFFQISGRMVRLLVQRHFASELAEFSSGMSDRELAQWRRLWVLYPAATIHSAIVSAFSIVRWAGWLNWIRASPENTQKSLFQFLWTPVLHDSSDIQYRRRLEYFKTDQTLMFVMLGYFIQDFLACYGTWTTDIPNTIHHIVATLLTFGCSFFGKYVPSSHMISH